MPITLDPSATFTGRPFISCPDATASPYSRLYTPLPIAKDTRDDCVHYFAGDDYQFDVAGSPYASNCLLAISVYNVDAESFASWNPALGDPSLPACVFQNGVRYYGSWYLQKPDEPDTGGGAAPTTTPGGTGTTTGPPGPTMSGSPANCNKWAVVTDGVSCTGMARDVGISLEQFLAWNPAVSSDCRTNYWLGDAYYVGVSGGSGTTPPVTTTTTASSPPAGPTKPPAEYLQAGQPGNCSKRDRCGAGEYCALLADRNGISVTRLAELNPVLGADGANFGT
ncbi:hypothetical protein RB595_008034 [Gaeumannomyces hyphopodioides]